MTVCASIDVPSGNRTERAGPSTSSSTASRVVTISAPNRTAWRRARSASWAPEIPSGKPR
ncbi:Uncharacterised protein [Mycobacteroides abscessus]|nr:Uncharacterised protein [Mycobacteroides abscessus]